MKALIVCYSLTGNTKIIAQHLANDINADFVKLEEIPERTIISAYTMGIFYSLRKKGSNIMPLEEGLSDYDTIILAGPIWAGNLTPAMYSFIRQYNLSNKVVYGLLTCKSLDSRDVAKIMREELINVHADCRSIITLRADKQTIKSIKVGEMHFGFDENNKLRVEKIEDENKYKVDNQEQN